MSKPKGILLKIIILTLIGNKQNLKYLLKDVKFILVFRFCEWSEETINFTEKCVFVLFPENIIWAVKGFQK